MADNPAAARRPSSSGKILGLRPRTALIVAGGAVAAGVLVFWWRRRSSAGTATATSGATGNCTDSTGATVPCPEQGAAVDQSGELSAIQTELETLLGEESRQGAPVAAGGGGGGTTPVGGRTTGKPPVTSPPQPRPGPASPPPEPAGVRITGVTAHGFTVSWTKAPGATSYGWRVTYQSKLVGSGTVTGTSAKVSGLTPDHTYTVHIRSIGPGGQSAETNGPAAKTPKG